MDSFTEKLISMVETRPVIYILSSRKDKNKDIIDTFWKEIATELKCSEHECKRKWAMLRNCYARELRIERTHKIKGRRWYLNNALSFLKDYIKPHRKIKQNSTENCSIDIESSCSLSPKQDCSVNKTSNYSSISVRSSPITFTAVNDKSETLIHETVWQDTNQLYDNSDYLKKFPADAASNCSTITIKSSPSPCTENIIKPVADAPQLQGNDELANKSNQLFLTSLVPDLNRLSERKQRIFKRKTIELLEHLFEEDDYETTMGESYRSNYEAPATNLDPISSWSIVELPGDHYEEPSEFPQINEQLLIPQIEVVNEIKVDRS